MKQPMLRLSHLTKIVALSLAAMLAAGQAAQAGSYYWDTNGANGFTSETGAWDGTNAFWNTDSTGASTGTLVAAPTSADDLNISGGTTGTVTITGTGTGSSLTISNNVITTITSGTLALGGTGTSSGLFVTSADNAATTVSSALTLNNAAVTIQNAGTGLLTLSGGITGAQNLILKNNSTNAAGITISTTSLNNSGTVTNSGSGTGGVTISSVIGTSVTGVTQNSSTSTLALSGANTYTGGTTISAGTLSVANVINNGNLGASTSGVTLNGGTLTVANTTAANGTFGSRTLTVGASGGTLNGSGAAGGTGQASRMIFNTANTLLGSGTLAISGGGSLNGFGQANGAVVLTGSQTYNGVVTISNGGVLSIETGGNLGSGATVAIGNNAELSIGNTNVIANVNVTGGTTSQMSWANGSSVLVGTLTLNANLTLANRNWFNANANSGTISGVVSGAGNLTVNGGAGTLTLSGANTYTGKTSIQQGTVSVASINSVSGGAATSSLGAPTTVANGTIDLGGSANSGSLIYTGTAGTTDRVINLNGTTGGAIITQSGASGLLKFTSNLTATGAGVKTLTLQGSTAGTGEIAGAIVNNSVTNTTALTKAGTGTWTLSGVNTYTGATTISAGVLTIGSAGQLGGGSYSANISNSGTFNYNSSANQTLSGVVSGAGPLGKNGSGTLTLSGVNTYTGATTVSNGTLAVTGTLATTGTVNVNAGGTLAGTSTSGGSSAVGTVIVAGGSSTRGTINLANVSAGTLNLGNLTVGDASDSTAFSQLNFDVVGTNADLLSLGSNVFTVNTGGAHLTISPIGLSSGQTVNLLTFASGAGTGFLTGNGTTVGSLTLSNPNLSFGVSGALNITNTAVQLVTSGVSAPTTAYWKGDQGGNWTDNDGTNGNFTTDKAGTTHVGAYPASTTDVIFAATGALLTSSTLGQDFAIKSLTFDDTTSAASISGTNTLTVGTGGITLLNGNGGAALGMTTLATNGSQTWTNGSTNNLTVNAAVTNNSGIAISNTSTGLTIINGVISGAGNMTLNNGVVQLNNTNSFNGGVTINSGTMTLGASNALGTSNSLTFGSGATGKLQINSNATTVAGLNTNATVGAPVIENGGATNAILTVNNTTSDTYAGVLQDGSGAGTLGLTKSGTGSLTLTGNNSYSGGTTLSAGQLNINNANALGSGALAISSGIIDNTSGSAITLAANNSQSWSGDFTFAGSNALNLGTGAVTLGANHTVTTSGASALTVGGPIGGSFNLTKAGTGTLTLTGSNAYTGITTVSAGTLNVTGALGGGSLQVAGGVFNLSGTLGTNTTSANFRVGNTASAPAVMNILTGAVANNRLNLFVGDGGSGTGGGAVYQSGGSLTLTQGAGVDNLRIGSNASGYGYYNLSGGSLTSNEVGVGASLNDTVGVMDVSGGTFTDNGYIYIARGNITSSGLLNVTGGSVSGVRIETLGGTAATATGIAIVNVGGGVGPALVSTVGSATIGLNLASASTNASARGFANLLANGTLTTGIVTASQSNPTTALNFNGGTLKATTTNAGANFINSTNIDAVTVYGNGGTIDNNSTNITIGNALLAASGTGVSSITLTSAGSGYVGAPLVTFSNPTSGTPATGYAVVNSGTISQIVITSPGTGYISAPTVTLSGGGASAAASGVAASLNTGNTSGGLTFLGSGTTTLSAVNTYAGATNVNAGSLNVTGVLDAGSAVNVASGAKLLGSGTIGGSLVVSGSLAGSLILNGDATVNSGATASASAFNGNVTDNGSITNAVAILSGKSISGTGSVAGLTVNSGATLNANTTNLTTGALNILGSGTFALTISTTAGTSSKVTASSLTLDATNTAVLTITDLGSDSVLSAGTKFTLIDYGAGAWNSGMFTFNGTVVNNGASITLGNNTYLLTYNDVVSGDNAVTLTAAAVPEPGTWAMLLGGLGLLVSFQRSRRRKP